MALAGKTTPGVSSGGSNKAAIPTPKNIAPNSLIVVPTAPYRRYAGPLIAKLEKYKALVDSKKLDDPLAKKLFGGELLIGPPGTSKTHFAKYIAQETGAAYFSVPALTGPEEVTFLFMQAREAAKNGPVIIMINEIECVGKREGGMLPQHQMYTLSTLLSELEDPRNIGVFVFFTSNAPELIDLAIRRPPRTVGEIFFAPPTRKERREMFIEELKSSGMKCPDEVIEYALSLTPGYVPGDIFGTAQKMIESAIFHKRNHFEKQDVDFAKELVKPSAMRDLPWVEPQIRMQHLTGNYILSAKDMLTRLGTRIDNGMRLIIYGPTGCGKTSICEALAGEFGYNLVIFDASDIVTKWVGEPGKIIGRILDHSKTFAPCVIVIDQAEGVIAPENPYSSEWTSVLKTRTSQPIPGVFLILNTVNPSFWGSELNGRFMKCYIPLPDKDSLVNVLQSTLPTDSGIDAAEVLATVNKNLVSRQIVETVRALVNLGIPLNTQTLIGALETLSELPNTSPNYYKPIVKDFGDDSRLLSVWTR